MCCLHYKTTSSPILAKMQDALRLTSLPLAVNKYIYQRENTRDTVQIIGANIQTT